MTSAPDNVICSADVFNLERVSLNVDSLTHSNASKVIEAMPFEIP